MISQDFGFQIKELSSRISAIERQFISMKKQPPDSDKVWDTAKLLKEWNISKRTAANYRLQGLDFYKQGGRLYYTPEHRQKFLKACNKIKHCVMVGMKDSRHDDYKKKQNENNR